jgi:hypothetical protein
MADGGAGAAAGLGAAAADELLTERALRTPFIRMAKEGAVLPPERFTASGGFGAQTPDQVDGTPLAAPGSDRSDRSRSRTA